MRILHISAFDDLGGAAQAAYRLHTGLLKKGIESRYFVSKRKGNKPFVLRNHNSIVRFWENAITTLDQLPNKYFRVKENEQFSNNYLPGIRIPSEEIKKADLIQLHWLGSGHLHPQQLVRFRKPLVWRLPDMFSFTGGCHYTSGCKHYEESCGDCPKLIHSGKYDISHLNWKRKEKAYKKTSDLTIVTPSKWLASCARKSSLLRGKEVITIPTGVDTHQYRPIDKSTVLDVLGIRHLAHKKIIAFGAINAAIDKRKGYLPLMRAIDKLIAQSDQEVCVLVIGAYKENTPQRFPVESYYLGHLSDQISLNMAYNASDVFIVPSLEENLPNTGLEAMACGVPVVGFDVGGMPDFIDHQENGYLAKLLDSDDLANGMQWVLEDPVRYKKLSKNARLKMEIGFDVNLTTEKYIQLYQTKISS